MKDMWTALAERTHAWHALDRQDLADAVWEPYVTARFARTGDRRALEYLYPYLNHSHSNTRNAAIRVAGRIFAGKGPEAVAELDYFTRNTDSFIRDRAVEVVGATVRGYAEEVVLEMLAPYLNSRNHFVQWRAMEALSRTLAGSASEKAFAEIERVREEARPDQLEVDWAVAHLYSGKPNEAAFGVLARPGATFDMVEDMAMGTLVRGADEAWYERGYREFFALRLHASADQFQGFAQQFVQRAAIAGLCTASPSRGMEMLRRLLHLQNNSVTCNVIMRMAPSCFSGVDVEGNKKQLTDLARSSKLHEQRIAAVCLGRLMMGIEDGESIDLLRDLIGSRNKALRAAALKGMGMAARYTGDEELREVCLEQAKDDETARAAIGALGMIFQASGRFDVFDDIRSQAEAYRRRPVQGRKQYRPLVQAYLSAGLVYQGTGSMEPVDFLLNALRPSPVQWCSYRAAAGKALVMTEFPESTLTRVYGNEWI